MSNTRKQAPQGSKGAAATRTIRSTATANRRLRLSEGHLQRGALFYAVFVSLTAVFIPRKENIAFFCKIFAQFKKKHYLCGGFYKILLNKIAIIYKI
jgi:hypothetical protein